MTIVAVVVAAGRGARMGAVRPKAFLRLGGRSLLRRSVAAFAAHPRIARVVVVVSDADEARADLGADAAGVMLVRGGAERQDSVRLGLQASGDADYVLVHDAARPLVSRRIIDDVLEAAERAGAAVPALPVAETVKRLGPDGAIVETVPREDLRLAQTPQAFRADLLRAAHEAAIRDGMRGTDDASLVERIGARVMVVPGSPRNIKITTPEDLVVAEALLRASGMEEETGGGTARG